MRSAILGVCFRDRWQVFRGLVRSATRITHTDPKAEWAAYAVALAASHSSLGQISPQGFQAALSLALGAEAREFLTLIAAAAASVERNEPTTAFATSLGQQDGVSGYCFHSVPVALHAWLSWTRDFRMAVLGVVRCGGDTDTTAAKVGAIAGAGCGEAGIPRERVAGLFEWLRSAAYLRELGNRLPGAVCRERPVPVSGVPFLAVLVRNAFFAFVVIGHIVRRMLPPY